MYSSTASISAMIWSTHFCSPFSAPSDDPVITGMSSPGNPYSDNSSLTSISTNSSNSSSSTISTLFKNTTMYGTPTWGIHILIIVLLLPFLLILVILRRQPYLLCSRIQRCMEHQLDEIIGYVHEFEA